MIFSEKDWRYYYQSRLNTLQQNEKQLTDTIKVDFAKTLDLNRTIRKNVKIRKGLRKEIRRIEKQLSKNA